ncbi:MAG: HAD family hydrolase, partial [Candidatus Omnitrophica bacterium]|nr:HAD family hydrolase [Candidatus Omnitrophota bacterium]
IDSFFPKDNIEKALKVYRRHHRKALVNYARLKPQAKSVLSSLKKQNKRLAVASNRPSYFTNILLKGLKIAKYFDGIWCADQVKAAKPDPKILKTILKYFKAERRSTVYVGDMDVDLEAARRAKVDAVFIRGGSSSLAEVKKYRRKTVISNLKQILELYN